MMRSAYNVDGALEFDMDSLGLECIFSFKQKTAYEMRISDWSSDVCSSDLHAEEQQHQPGRISEELRDGPGRGADGRQQRDLHDAEEGADDGAADHREKADREIENEALQQDRKSVG